MDTRYNYKVAQWIDNIGALWNEFMGLSDRYQEIVKCWFPYSGYTYYTMKDGFLYYDIICFPYSCYAIWSKMILDNPDAKEKLMKALHLPESELTPNKLSILLKEFIRQTLDHSTRRIECFEKALGGGLLVNIKEISERMDYAKKLIPQVEYYSPQSYSFEQVAYYVMAHIRNEMAQLDEIGRHGYLLQYLTPTFADSLNGLPESYSYAINYVKKIIGRDVWFEVETARDVVIWEMRAIIHDFRLDISHLEESVGMDLTSLVEAKAPDTKDKRTKWSLLTTAQRVLFLKHALGEMGVFISERNGDGGVSQRDIARLVHVILGGNAEKIENTSVYKAMKKIDSTPSEHDAKKLRQVIEQMGFSDIANQLK